MSPGYRLRLGLTAHDPDKLAIVDYTKITPRPTPTPRSVTVPQKMGARRSERPYGELIYFCRDHPNRLKPNAMQKCYICGHLWREIDNKGTRLTGCLNCNFWTARDGKEWRRLTVADLNSLRRPRTGRASRKKKISA